MKFYLVIILIHGIYLVSCVERFFNEAEENVSNRIKRLDVKDGEFTNRIVFTTTREDDPILWFNQKFPQYEYIGQFWIGKTKYITAQIRQTKTKEILSTLREDSDVEVLRQRPEISWVIQEKAYVRKTRTMDTEWPNLWHLNGDISPTLKVNEAWTAGYSGQGINIAVLDDGLQTDHLDLAANVMTIPARMFSLEEECTIGLNKMDTPDVAITSTEVDTTTTEFNPDTANDKDIYGVDNDPYPPAGNSHGTQVSGFIGAVKDNNICVVGVAFSCTLIGIRILGSFAISDSEEAEGLSHYLSNVDIYSNSWGPGDGTGFNGPGSVTKAALQDGVTNGRNGKGAIYIFAAGNGGTADNCNADGYVNSIYTVAISSAMIGSNAWYSEVCAPALAAAYGGSQDDRYLTTTTTSSGCISGGIQGTSYAAPIASGIVALTLEANPNLTWRDIQHLIVFTSNRNGLNDTYSDWSMNGANKEFSQVLGFGLMDAEAMVSYGKNWVTVPTQQTCNSSTSSPALSTTTSTSDSITVTSGDCSSIQYLEHVVVDITFSYSGLRGVTQLYLVSPSGTKSHLLHYRNQDAVDNSAAGSLTWDFMSVHFWKENPIGSWTLEMSPKLDFVTVTLDSWSLKLHGTSTDPWPSVEQTTSPISTDITTHLEVTTKNVLTTEISTEPITESTTMIPATKITTESITPSTSKIPTTEIRSESTTSITSKISTTAATTERVEQTTSPISTDITTHLEVTTKNVLTTEISTEPITESTTMIPATKITTESITPSTSKIPTTEIRSESTTSITSKISTTAATTERVEQTTSPISADITTHLDVITKNILTTEISMEPITESTTMIPATKITTESTKPITSEISTTVIITESTTQITSEIPTTAATTESTTPITSEIPTTAATTESTTPITSEIPTTAATTESTTPITSEIPLIAATTESTTPITSEIQTTAATTEYTTPITPEIPTTEVTTESTTPITSKTQTTEFTTESTAPITSKIPTAEIATESTTQITSEIPTTEVTTESTAPITSKIPAAEVTTELTTPITSKIPTTIVTSESTTPITTTIPTMEVTTESKTLITTLKPTQDSPTKEQTTEATTKDSTTESTTLSSSNEGAIGTKATLNNINTPIIAGSIGAVVAVLSLIGAIYATYAAKQSINKPDIQKQQTSEFSDVYDSRQFPAVTPRYGSRISWY